MPAVQCTCTGNAIVTLFAPFDPAQEMSLRTPDPRPTFQGGSGHETMKDTGQYYSLIPRLLLMVWERDRPVLLKRLSNGEFVNVKLFECIFT